MIHLEAEREWRKKKKKGKEKERKKSLNQRINQSRWDMGLGLRVWGSGHGALGMVRAWAVGMGCGHRLWAWGYGFGALGMGP